MSSPPAIAAGTVPGPVTLTVTDLDATRDFYASVLGLEPVSDPDGDASVALGAGGSPLVRLHRDPDAAARDPRAPGLFHVALLFPTRADLADALHRVAVSRWPLSGASDHLVSEALYLSDPEGNGIELYRDRPRDEWPHDADGSLEMATLRLDLEDLLTVATGLDQSGPPAPVATGTRVGHVHLQVADLPRAAAFYHQLLGFEITVERYPGALFVAAGGYHHHLGLNTWNSAGSPPRDAGACGLRRYDLVVPDAAELARLHARLGEAGVQVTEMPGGLTLADPFGIPVRLLAG